MREPQCLWTWFANIYTEVNMKNKILITGMTSLLLAAAPLTFGQQNPAQGASQAGQQVASGTSTGAKKLARGTSRGASQFGSSASDAGRNISRGRPISAAGNIGKGTGQLGAQTGKGVGGFFSNTASGIGHGAASMAKGVWHIF